MVEQADVYVGIFANRYGYVPDGHKISITEMEYERAVFREIPRLIFLIDRQHAVLGEDVDKDERALRLEALKSRLKAERVVSSFRSAENLCGKPQPASDAA